MKSIAFVGGYNTAYPRVDVVIRGLCGQGYRIEHFQVPWSSPFRRKLWMRKLLRERTINTDVVIVPAFCHHEMPVVRKFTSKPIIFDPLISRYLTKVHDLKKVSPFSLHAWINYRIDRDSMKAADIVLADTEAHKDYFCSRFAVDPRKVEVVPVGYNSNDFFPEPGLSGREGQFTVGFYGSFLPLHGIQHIIDAASLLREYSGIRFELIGSGHTYQVMRNKVETMGLENVLFLGRKKYEELNGYINRWDICLGVFGSTLKAGFVIPNKVFHYAGCRKPIITMNSKAIKELFEDRESVLLCDSDPDAIAEKIRDLYVDSVLREKIAGNAYKTVCPGYTHFGIGSKIGRLIENIS
ncbi:MAG: glycosyltransferase [Chitinispirillaceae bacterium]